MLSLQLSHVVMRYKGAKQRIEDGIMQDEKARARA